MDQKLKIRTLVDRILNQCEKEGFTLKEVLTLADEFRRTINEMHNKKINVKFQTPWNSHTHDLHDIPCHTFNSPEHRGL